MSNRKHKGSRSAKKTKNKAIPLPESGIKKGGSSIHEHETAPRPAPKKSSAKGRKKK